MSTLSLSLLQAASCIPDAQIIGDPHTLFTSISIDSRTVTPGALFIALPGEQTDGHAFLTQALAQGASAVLVSEKQALDRATSHALRPVIPALHVPDTALALGMLARYWRTSFTIPIVAVTGSNGKTTVKEMISAIFAAAVGSGQRLATQGNLNNHLGVPLTLLRLQKTHRLAVIELGMNHPGETQYLAALAQPTIALINNAQREHQEFMENVEAVALEHTGVLHALASNGIAVFPAEDPYSPIWRHAAGQRQIIDFALYTAHDTLTSAHSAIVQGTVKTKPSLPNPALEIKTPIGSITVILQAPGMHNLHNALAATAVGLAAGADLQAIKQGLESFTPVPGRLALQKIATGPWAGIRVIDDSYNANPDSMRAAIDVLADYASPRILFMGDMGEVGTQSQAFHHEIGAYAQIRGIDRLYTLGKESRYACEAFGTGATHFETFESLIDCIQNTHFDQHTTLLIKGSRFTKMERLIQKFSV